MSKPIQASCTLSDGVTISAENSNTQCDPKNIYVFCLLSNKQNQFNLKNSINQPFSQVFHGILTVMKQYYQEFAPTVEIIRHPIKFNR